MDNLTFIQKLIDTLVWPATALIMLGILRQPISNVVESVSKLKYKDIEVEIAKKDIKKLSPVVDGPYDNVLDIGNLKYIKSLAEISTTSAITESWQGLEKAIYVLAGVDRRQKGDGFSKVLLSMKETKQISDSTIDLIRKLRDIRNTVVHLDSDSFSEKDAIGYALSCEQVKSTLTLLKKVA